MNAKTYVQSNLLAGEEAIYQAEPHWIVLAVPGFFTGLGLLGLAGGSEGFGILVLIGGVFLIPRAITYFTLELAVTTKRVVYKEGLIARNSFEVLLTQVEGVDIRQGYLGRMLDYGSLSLRGTGGMVRWIQRMRNPLRLREEIVRQVGLHQKN